MKLNPTAQPSAPTTAPDAPAPCVLVVIRDADNAQYDRYVMSPPGMSLRDAARSVDAIIDLVKAHSDDYDSDALDAPLEALGFTWPSTIDADNSW